MAKTIYNLEDRDSTLASVKVILMTDYKEKADYLYNGLPEFEKVLNIVPGEHGDYCEVFEVADECPTYSKFDLDTESRPTYKAYKKLSDFLKLYETSRLDILIVIS